MFQAASDWSSPSSSAMAPAVNTAQAGNGTLAALYRQFRQFLDRDDAEVRHHAARFLSETVSRLDLSACDLPTQPGDLEAWMHASAQQATDRYSQYLEERKAGAPRRYFSNRAHALYFLRTAAPTKLVDGAWLYGLVKHWRNPRFSDLLKTYVEELGEGDAGKNHVVIYRKLLARYGVDTVEDMDDSFYTQGVIQSALACSAQEFLPEVIGFNLGYEQLPLHLLITAYELNELGIDPYYFTLHITVDNPDTGHARRAVQAVLDNMPRLGDTHDYWHRVRAGYQLSNVGVGSTALIEGFDIGQEVVRIFSHKSAAGHGAHSDYCRVAGRHINDWLAQKEDIPEFLAALEKAGWIKRGAPVGQSRFWGLLQGPRAEMFGVFSGYELQVIHDWIRGESSYDGQAYTEAPSPDGGARRPSFRVAARLAATRGEAGFGAMADGCDDLLDIDLQALNAQLLSLDEEGRIELLLRAMAPSQHWTPAGLHATRVFCARLQQ